MSRAGRYSIWRCCLSGVAEPPRYVLFFFPNNSGLYLAMPNISFLLSPKLFTHKELSPVGRTKDKPSAPRIIFLALAKVKATKANQHKPCLMFGRITVAPSLPSVHGIEFSVLHRAELCLPQLLPGVSLC